MSILLEMFALINKITLKTFRDLSRPLVHAFLWTESKKREFLTQGFEHIER